MKLLAQRGFMRKTLNFIVLAAVAVLVFAGTAYAATTISFSPTGLVEVPAFPYTTDVSGTFTTDDEDGLCINANGTDWQLWVEDENENELAIDSGSYLRTDPPQPTCPAGSQKAETLFNVEFPQAGTYTLYATLKTRQGADLDLQEDDELILILQQEIIVTYPAAPSVAARILFENNISARYGSGKTGGNHIADVARQMGPGTDFNGVRKRDTEAYAEAVVEFLQIKQPPALP